MSKNEWARFSTIDSFRELSYTLGEACKLTVRVNGTQLLFAEPSCVHLNLL